MNYAEQLVQQGRQEGRQQGLQEGRQQGLQEGLQERQTQIAGKLLQAGVPAATVAAATGIDIDALHALARDAADDEID